MNKVYLILISLFFFGTIFAEEKFRNPISVIPSAELIVSSQGTQLQGISAAFSGIIHNIPVIAGGCNFPNTPAAESGEKKYYNSIFALIHDSWVEVGQLPEALAYGVSATFGNQIICIGGMNGNGGTNKVYSLQWNSTKDKIESKELISLPIPMDNMCGGIGKDKIYIAGGYTSNKPTNRFFSIDARKLLVGKGGWEELPSFPGGYRVQPCGVVQNSTTESAFYLFGGFDPQMRTANTTALMYSPKEQKWIKDSSLSINNESFTLVGATAVPSGGNHILFFGGVDKTLFESALNITDSDIKYDYMIQDPEWYQFCSYLRVYHTITKTWTAHGEENSLLARAGAAVIPQGNEQWLIVCGETKPGFRSIESTIISMKTRKEFGTINWIVLVIYMLGMLFLGYYFMMREKSSEDFFKGGGRIPWWAAGMSIYATMLSAITYMAIPAKAYATDFRFYPMMFTILIMAFPVVKYYLPFFRRMNITTAYEYLEIRFNYFTRLLSSILFMTFMIARMALVLYLPSLALTTVTGIDIYICIILMGIVTIIYCTMGGVEAVIWGDVIQGIILVGGAIFAVVYLIFGTEGGITESIRIAMSDNKFKMLDFTFDWSKPTFWVVVLGGMANNLISYTSDQTVIQRYLTTKDEKGAANGIFMNGIMSASVGIIFYAIGAGLYTFYKSHPTRMSYTLTNADAIFPDFMMSELPIGIAGLMIAAIFAATMSTISSNINSISTAFTIDIYKKVYPKTSDKQTLSIARWCSLFVGAMGVGIAIIMASSNLLSMFDYFNTILGLLTSGLGGLFLVGIFFRRVGTIAALCGFFISTIGVFFLSIYSNASFMMYGFTGIVLSVVISYITSFIFKNEKAAIGLTWKTMNNNNKLCKYIIRK